MRIDRTKLKKSSSEVVSNNQCLSILVSSILSYFPAIVSCTQSRNLIIVVLQPHDCKLLIERLKGCNESDLLIELKKIKAWNYGKVNRKTLDSFFPFVFFLSFLPYLI